MFPEVHQDVDERVPYGARRGERPCVVPVSEDVSAPSQGAVDGTCEPDRNAANAAGKGEAIIGLGDEVYVVVLDAEFDDPERRSGAGDQRSAHRRKDAG